MYLLDTNACIYLIKNTYPSLSSKLFSMHPSEFFISSITVFELEYGASKSKWGDQTRQKLALFLAPFQILPFTTDDAVNAGRIRGSLEEKGTPIGPYDVLIAAQAITKHLTVITKNIDEFKRVPSLAVEDWTIS